MTSWNNPLRNKLGHKRPWLKRGLLGVAVAALTLGGLSACGHGPRHGAPLSEAEVTQLSDKVVERISSRLDLDAPQKQHLQTLASTLQTQRRQVMGDPATPMRSELQALMASERFDVARANAWVQRKTDALQSASPAVIQALADFYDSLRPEQQAKVREFMAKERHHGWRG